MDRVYHNPAAFLIPWVLVVQAYGQERLPDSALLTSGGDFSTQMVAGIDRYLSRATADSVIERLQLWNRDFGSPEHYAESVEPNRARFRTSLAQLTNRQSRLC